MTVGGEEAERVAGSVAQPSLSPDTQPPLVSDPGRRNESKRFSENNYNRAQTLAAWLLATLVAVNTSGAAAILAKGGDVTRLRFFAAGIACAIVSGLASWGEAYNKASQHFVESLESPTKEELATRRTCKWWGPKLFAAAFALNVASLVAFVLGCAF